MAVQLSTCDPACRDCVHQYAQKHRLKRGDRFSIGCSGIPKDYLSAGMRSVIDDPEFAISILDPVTWAAKNLDWHCLDPKGEVWKRKSEEGTLGELPSYDASLARQGRSPFNRPYQAIMLRCQSKRKVFRIGRQAGKTDTLCISILYNLFTHDNFSILVITPYQSQIELIFSRLIELLKRSAGLFSDVIRHVKAPNYSLELANGAKVTAFTAGTKSKGEAGASRGQKANQLIFDEADYLSPADLDTALAVITNFPDATVWMSSTPTGRREKFYTTCQSKLYKEFHFPATVNPMYSEDLDAYFRENYTELGYLHEVLAEFGEQEEGVFQSRYVDLAQDSTYTYGATKPRNNWIYSIGVDWNDVKIGTTIIVTGYNPGDHTFRVVDKRIISKAGWTQLTACQAVVELNRFWQPAFIYVDHGFGHVQVEVLRKFGADALVDPQRGPTSIDARLARIVKPFDFGGSLEINDLFTKQPIKKPAKAFMVESTVRRFETQTIKFPAEDKNLDASLRGYIVKRVSQSGVPIYEAQNEAVGDHLIDALCLSIIGFVLEKTEFGQLTFETYIAFSGNFGEKLIPGPFPLNEEKKENLKPKSRVENITERPMGNRLPAAHTSSECASLKIWSWPGFLKDLPPPKSNKRVALHRTKPHRTKF